MKAAALIPTSLVKRLVVVATAAALVTGGALAQDAQASSVSFSGGWASVDPVCHVNLAGNTTELLATNASDRDVYYVIYIQNLTYPHLSGWQTQDWRVLPARESGRASTTWGLGALVPLGSGLVRVYIHYAYVDNGRWQTVGVWSSFHVPHDALDRPINGQSDYCRV
jgi:hypothetical protein